MQEYIVTRDFTWPPPRRWWLAKVPPWSTLLILSAALVTGWIVGLHWF